MEVQEQLLSEIFTQDQFLDLVVLFIYINSKYIIKYKYIYIYIHLTFNLENKNIIMDLINLINSTNSLK